MRDDKEGASDSIGGFPSFVTEDTFFSFESDVKGFKSLYVPKVYALGKPIVTFTELVKQQWRYNYGDTQFIGYFFNHLRKKEKRKTLSPLSRIDYFTHGMGLNYISVIIIVFTVLSILITFSQFPITNLKLTNLLTANYISFDLEVIGLTALALSVATPMFLAKMYFNSFKKGFMMFLLNFALAFDPEGCPVCHIQQRAEDNLGPRPAFKGLWKAHLRGQELHDGVLVLGASDNPGAFRGGS